MMYPKPKKKVKKPKPLKRTPLKRGDKPVNKIKKTKTGTAKRRAWSAFSLYIRSRDSKNGESNCITCGRKYPIKELQAGHWLPGRHISVLFDERNCHAQCYGCNVGQKGNPIKYYHFMEKQYGKEIMEELEELDKQIIKMTTEDYLEIEKYYKLLLDKLNNIL